ncbi:ABC transporter ATP-binding protein (plasmid) [Agrobacterium salinitolerans]|uniref:ABC transporter ATP-binding protein n=1 Tax=Agrobacterium salinitolerans TaxID=1183413 RepID=UPI001C21FA70|nr:ABC transporter ATP-binding protein [Agrobacterium salinitolerans]QXC52519.1 ABC transporter ATP-binding protein [Agrobacterium salinitolerans]
MTFLQLNGLRKNYGSFVAVDTVTLNVARGEFISLLGPSGCGKTTTLQMIAGFLKPTAGSIQLDGRNLGEVRPSERGLGVVFQSYALFPHMTVAENVAFGLDMRRVSEPERSRRVAEVLDLVHLGAMKNRLPSQLSGGQRQRVALARALVIAPPILLLDEPLSNLDAKLREDMQIELRRIQRTVGTTTIMVTHDQSEAMALSDRIAVMNRGLIEQIGPPHEVYERPSTTFVSTFLGKTNLLRGRVRRGPGEQGAFVVNDIILPFAGQPDMAGDELSISLRPEKIRFQPASRAGPSAVTAQVHMRVFCGDHWIYELDSPVGRLMVRRQNDGAPVDEGQTVGLEWDSNDMQVVRAANV